MSAAPLMEQMAIYFAGLPCPPLPVMSAWGEDGRVAPCNSHDILALNLYQAMKCDNRELNEKRKAFQIDATRRLITAFAATPEPGPERVYYLCQQFTADYICAFAAQPRGVHFAPIDDIQPGEPIHTACCGWSAGQDIIHTPKEARRPATAFSRLSYRELIMAHYARVRSAVSATGENPWVAHGLTTQ